MATPRALLVDPDHALNYHLVSRCVRRSWLCGWDKVRRKDYSHRKHALEARLLRLVPCFAVELHAFAIMSNHFHLVVRYDPLACVEWSTREVAQRWIAAVAPPEVLEDAQLRHARIEALCAQPEKIKRLRERLGSMSAFMQHLKQPIARQANHEDQVTGHFFEQRFYSGALLCEEAVLAAMAYVDLNPVRARIARDIEQSEHTSISRRLKQNSIERLQQVLRPLASGLQDDAHAELTITLGEYIETLRVLVTHERKAADRTVSQPADRTQLWAQQVAMLAKRQRAFGNQRQLEHWQQQRNMRALEVPFA
jgi:putative transposase